MSPDLDAQRAAIMREKSDEVRSIGAIEAMVDVLEPDCPVRTRVPSANITSRPNMLSVAVP